MTSFRDPCPINPRIPDLLAVSNSDISGIACGKHSAGKNSFSINILSAFEKVSC